MNRYNSMDVAALGLDDSYQEISEETFSNNLRELQVRESISSTIPVHNFNPSVPPPDDE